MFESKQPYKGYIVSAFLGGILGAVSTIYMKKGYIKKINKKVFKHLNIDHLMNEFDFLKPKAKPKPKTKKATSSRKKKHKHK